MYSRNHLFCKLQFIDFFLVIWKVSEFYKIAFLIATYSIDLTNNENIYIFTNKSLNNLRLPNLLLHLRTPRLPLRHFYFYSRCFSQFLKKLSLLFWGFMDFFWFQAHLHQLQYHRSFNLILRSFCPHLDNHRTAFPHQNRLVKDLPIINHHNFLLSLFPIDLWSKKKYSQVGSFEG